MMDNSLSRSARSNNLGPWDRADLNAPTDLVDFGAISFVPNPNVVVRADIEEATQKVVAISFDYLESVLQVQAFAASKGESLWELVLGDIVENLSSQGLALIQSHGPFGPELSVDLPIASGKVQKVRMFGVDGGRWLLRGTISGAAVFDLEQRTELEKIFRGLVVNRGETPLPPREILQLTLPVGSITTRAN
jgi:hypothetical protein